MKHLPLALALVAVLLGLGWLKAHDARVFADAMVSTVLVRVDSMAEANANLKREVEFKDLAYDALQADLDSAYTRAERDRTASLQRERRATAQLATARSVLDATLGSLGPSADSIRAHLEDERDAHESLAESLRAQVGALSIQLLATDSSLVLERERTASRDVLIASLETALTEERGLREFYQGRADPGLLTKLWRDAPSYVGVGGLMSLAVLAVVR